MAIEFRCTKCNKLLRTADDTAGKHAKCPECGEILVIPAAGVSAPPPMPTPAAGAGGFPPPPPSGPTGGSPFGAGEQPQYQPDTGNPYQSPSPYAPLPAAPMGAGEIRPTIIDAGDVMSRAWGIFKDQLWMCVGAFFVVWICDLAFGYMTGSILGLFIPQPTFPFQNGNVPPQQFFVQMMQNYPRQMVAGQLNGLINLLFTAWTFTGLNIVLLKVAHGKQASIGDLFSGGKYYVPMLVTMLIFKIMTSVGFLLLIVPGIIVYILFSQYAYLIIDRNMGIGDSLQMSLEITKGNRMTIFLICLISIGLAILGAFAFCIGVFFAMPLIYLIWVVAYLSMTGQPTIDQMRAGMGMR